MHAFFVPPLDSEEDTGFRMPPECIVLVWSCLSLPEQMHCSSANSASRSCAPAAVRVAAAAQAFCQALPSGASACSELRFLTELAGAERTELWRQYPSIFTLLCSVVQSLKLPIATRRCAILNIGRQLGNQRTLLELFAMYDLPEHSTSMIEQTIEVLAGAARQDVLCPVVLDALLGITRAVVAGLRGSSSVQQDCPLATAFAKKRAHTRWLISSFNRDPEVWWQETFADMGMTQEAAQFVAGHRRSLDCVKLGVFLARHEDVLSAFLQLFDLEGLGIIPALLQVLRGIQMPGEAQQVDRFCEYFGKAWGSANGIDPEHAYIFMFSLVMLSTDLQMPPSARHTPMTLAQFEKNLGCALPEGSLPQAMIQDAYSQLRAGSLMHRSKEDQVGPQEICTHLHHSLCRRTVDSNPISALTRLPPVSTESLDCLWAPLWSVIWGPLISAFGVGAYDAAGKEALLERALRGLQLGCEAAALLGEIVQAEAFSTSLQQFSPQELR